MFLGGILPGVLLGLSEMVLCYIFAIRKNYPRNPKMSWKERITVTKQALPALGLPVIILGGIVSGIFTATEASAVAVVYALLVAVFRKSITLKSLYECCKNAAKTTANVMIIIAVAAAMGYAITILRIPQNMVAFWMGVIGSKMAFLIFVNILLLVLGCFLDQSPALLIMVPILLPIAEAFGIDPIHFGIICCFNLTVGLITPPVGMTLYVTANVAGIKLTDLFRRIVPFVIVGIIALIVITYVPWITTFLPGLFN